MSNPYEFRDLMKAVYRYSDEDPDTVIKRMNAKHDSKSKGKRGAPGHGKVPADQLAKMKAINAAAKARHEAAKPAVGEASG